MSEDFEGVSLLVSPETWDAPEHAERLQCPPGDDSAAIKRLPAELANNLRDNGLGGLVVTAQNIVGVPWSKSGFTMRVLPTLLKALTTCAIGISAWILSPSDSLGPVVYRRDLFAASCFACHVNS